VRDEAPNVTLPRVLGGELRASALDRLIGADHAGRARKDLDVGVSIISATDDATAPVKESGVPEFHFGDDFRIAYSCAELCFCVVLHRTAAGHYTVVRANEEALEGTRTEHVRVVPPAGREQFIFLRSSHPLDPGDLEDDATLAGSGITISVAEYEVRPEEKR
jgi:hypothetical protein